MASSLEGNARKVGDPVWVFDVNRRVYRPDRKGGPIWREHWRPAEITGETSRSWVIGRGCNERKIPKNGPTPHDIAWSAVEIDKRAYVEENAYLISEKVRRVSDYDLLKKIAEMVGYQQQ